MVAQSNRLMVGAFIIGLLFILHQLVIFGYAFEAQDVLHHEVFASVLWSFALGIWVATNMRRGIKR